MKFLVINGPNLQLLGQREPAIYGSETLAMLCCRLRDTADSLGIEVDFFQSNHEGDLVDRIGQTLLERDIDAIVINPGAYTHTSIAILDALRACALPAIEVHISNINSRESFRHTSITSAGCIGMIAGLGTDGYEWALCALKRYLDKKSNTNKQ